VERSAARGFTLSLFLVFAAGLAPLPGQTSSDTAPVTAPKSLASQAAAIKFGDYPAGSQASYDTWVRSSLYLKMRDGVRLAVDILRPARKGVVETKPLPALWTHTRYRRASVVNGKIRSPLEAQHLLALLRRGYVLAAVDGLGQGQRRDAAARAGADHDDLSG